MNDLETKRVESMIGKVHTFRGKDLPPYAAGHRALVFSVIRKNQNVESPMMVWLVLFVLIKPLSEAVAVCTGENPWPTIMEFANSFEPGSNEEASAVVNAIFDEVRVARVETTGGSEKKA